MKKAGTFFLKRDSLQLGLLLGIITPILIFIIIYLFRFNGFSLAEFKEVFIQNKNRLITFFGVWSLVGNIALFTYYVNTHRDHTAKGIFAVSLVYGVGVLVAKLLF